MKDPTIDNQLFNSHHGGQDAAYWLSNSIESQREGRRPSSGRRYLYQVANAPEGSSASRQSQKQTPAKRKPAKVAIYQTLIPHRDNVKCGVKEVGHELDRLKLEVSVGVSNFWKKRGLSDPGRLAWRST